jgi:hypothetical protein
MKVSTIRQARGAYKKNGFGHRLLTQFRGCSKLEFSFITAVSPSTDVYFQFYRLCRADEVFGRSGDDVTAPLQCDCG